MNIVCLSGNVCFDPELRFTAGGTAVCTFRLAVNRNKDQADFIDVVAFNSKNGNNLAERCAEWLQKGTKVAVTGRWQSETYEDRDGNKRTSHKCIASAVDFLANTRPREEQQPQQSYQPHQQGFRPGPDPDEIPF